MSRSLRLAHLPPMHPRLRFSGYLTSSATDGAVTEALGPFLMNLKLWRSSASLPKDWPVSDDSVIQQPPPNVVPIWGEGDDTSSAAFIGDPETPWRLLVGSGQLVVENVWLFDPSADPWPASLTTCPPCAPASIASASKSCPPCMTETVRAPTECNSTSIGVLGAALGVTATAATIWWLRS